MTSTLVAAGDGDDGRDRTRLLGERLRRTLAQRPDPLRTLPGVGANRRPIGPDKRA